LGRINRIYGVSARAEQVAGYQWNFGYITD
jgi:hypothetical protein